MKFILNFMQCQVFVAADSTPVNVKKIFFDKFLYPLGAEF